jgi:hypothetical protein
MMMDTVQAVGGQTTDQLKLLLDYTIFHLGLYTTVVTGLIGVSQYLGTSSPKIVKAATCCFVLAGMAGGVIASNIPNFKDWSAFSTAILGPWEFQWLTYADWARIEHTTFWLGVILGVSAYLFSQPKKSVGFNP